MAKLLLYSDNHWCKYSSIVRSMGSKYSTRLENQIESINWAEKLAVENNCNAVMMLGDFFDSQQLDAMELTALQEIEWADLPHYILCGNHEQGSSDMKFSSAHLFNLKGRLHVIDKPSTQNFDGCEVCFLPYMLEADRKSLNDYFNESKGKRVILSHNDLKGIQLGPYLTQTGFSVEEIQNNCDLFINGHLHNGGKVADKIINIGNLTGQNFSEDASKYDHVAFILDTDTLQVAVYENPYALNFYKLDLTQLVDSPQIVDFPTLKQNAVISVKCYNKDLEHYKEVFKNVLASRFIIEQEVKESTNNQEVLTVDHLQKFKEYIIQELGSSEEVLMELDEVTK